MHVFVSVSLLVQRKSGLTKCHKETYWDLVLFKNIAQCLSEKDHSKYAGEQLRKLRMESCWWSDPLKTECLCYLASLLEVLWILFRFNQLLRHPQVVEVMWLIVELHFIKHSFYIHSFTKSAETPFLIRAYASVCVGVGLVCTFKLHIRCSTPNLSISLKSKGNPMQIKLLWSSPLV